MLHVDFDGLDSPILPVNYTTIKRTDSTLFSDCILGLCNTF